ncbi:hypothetical protein KX928_15530 [Roseobacter sp. YSTF-M11]|uniref:Uncharacterized protein n=1 Tax=Roseobacter insulae TaxID=2859783 RepID=A0A9X1FXP1_9RHOB|nr:hypothetical protein [Roseobacter insulae]MBW4709202.1 hypothetical protein [Roseobacter insulae]
MQKPEFTDEELMAYADGELPEDRAAALDLALMNSTDLTDRLALFMDTKAAAKEAMEPLLRQPVPDHLVETVRALSAADQQARMSSDDTVVAFPQDTAAPAQSPVWKLPLAAGLALAVGLGAGLMLSPDSSTGLGSIEIAALADTRIIAALDTLPSGEDVVLPDGARIAPIATFFDGARTLCREFEFDRADGTTVVSVACQRNGQWDVQMAIAAAAASDTGYAPASSLDTLDAYLSANDAGPPLDPDAEAAALSTLR